MHVEAGIVSLKYSQRSVVSGKGFSPTKNVHVARIIWFDTTADVRGHPFQNSQHTKREVYDGVTLKPESEHSVCIRDHVECRDDDPQQQSDGCIFREQ